MALIDGKYITVESEAADFPVTVTEQPVEKSINLSDHIQPGARTLSLSGVIAGTQAAQTRAYLITAKDKGQIVKFVGRNTFNGLITSLSTSTDHTTADGFSYTMEIREIRIATSSYSGKLPTPIQAQVVKIVNSGTKQTKEKKTSKNSKGKKGSTAKKKGKEKVQKVQFKTGSKWAK